MMLKKKRGASLAESVVALAVITIVSMAAISAVAFALNAQVKALRNTKAQDFSRSVFESFKVSDDYNTFVSNINFAEDTTMPPATPQDGYPKTYVYTSITYKFVATITVNYDSTPPTLSVIVTEDGDPDDEVISFNYTKGGGT